MAKKENILIITKGSLYRQSVLEALDLPEVISFLEAYLYGQVAVTTTQQKALRPKKICRKKILPLDTLLASIALISERIINKYCNGGQPHFERMRLWGLSLQIVDEFMKLEILPEPREIEYIKNGYFFRCLAFNTAVVGDIIIPLDTPDVGTYDIDMPEICVKKFEGLDKSTARRNIMEYASEKQLKATRWSYVYILRCADGTFYTGWTTNLYYCQYLHHLGKERAIYTRSRRPCKLVYWKVCHSEQEAMELQDQIRRYSRESKLRLIENSNVKAD